MGLSAVSSSNLILPGWR